MAITVGRVIDLNFEPFYIDMERRGIVLQEVSLKDMPQALRDGSVNAGPVTVSYTHLTLPTTPYV